MFKSVLNKLYKLLILFYLFISVSFVYAKDLKYSFEPAGGMQADYYYWYGDKKHDELIYGGYLRTIDFFAKGFILNEHINYFLHFNLTDYSYENCFSECYLKVFNKNFSFKVGQFLLPFGLEEAISPYEKTFFETSFLSGMGDGKFCGASFNINFKYFSFLSTVAVPSYICSLHNKYNFKRLVSFRTFLNFFRRDNFGFHVGIDFKRVIEDQKGSNPSSGIPYRDNPSLKSHASLLNAYDSEISAANVVGLELLVFFKSLALHWELGFVDVRWRDFDNEIYSSQYVQVSYFFGGINRKYDNYNGCVRHPVKYKSYGAVELLVKFCVVDILNYGPLLLGFCETDGRKEIYTLGINWIINRNVKVQLNFIIDTFLYRRYRGFELGGIGLRFQLEY